MQRDAKSTAPYLNEIEDLPGLVTPSDSELAAVASLTFEVFGDQPLFKSTVDPEDDGAYIVVVVWLDESAQAAAEKVRIWHRRMAAEVASETIFALSPRFH